MRCLARMVSVSQLYSGTARRPGSINREPDLCRGRLPRNRPLPDAGNTVLFEGIAPDTPRPAPRLSQHTEEGLADVADLLSGVIDKLMGDGVVMQPCGDSRMAL